MDCWCSLFEETEWNAVSQNAGEDVRRERLSRTVNGKGVTVQACVGSLRMCLCCCLRDDSGLMCC